MKRLLVLAFVSLVALAATVGVDAYAGAERAWAAPVEAGSNTADGIERGLAPGRVMPDEPQGEAGSSCEKQVSETASEVGRRIVGSGTAVWGAVSQEWVACRIDAGEVSEITFLEHTGVALAELADGRRVEFRVDAAGGAWFAARAADAGVTVHASETPKLETAEAPAGKSSGVGAFVALGLFVAFAAWVSVRYWREHRKVAVPAQPGVLRRRSSGGEEVPDTRFGDVAGCAEAIEDLREIVEVLRNPERYEALGAVAPKGALLVGPPGTGKTLLARAVAGEAGVPFFAAAGSDFVEMYVGVGAKRVRALFEKARKAGGGIVFIDEIDAVGRKRSDGHVSGGEQESENTLIALLNELDGFRQANIVVLAATNRPDVLDPALVRPGRLDRRVHVGLPDEAEREAILRVHLRGKPLRDGVSLGRIAKRTAQMSGAQLAQICNEAALGAARVGAEKITEAHLGEAVEYIAMGRARRSAKVSEQDRTVTAWHEAGHAVCALRQADAERPVAVSIVPRGEAGGVTWMSGPETQLLSRAKLRARLVVALGGRAAEEILMHGEHTAGAASDLSQATEIARAMVDRFGMTGRGLAVRPGGTDGSEDAVEELLGWAMDEARGVLAQHRALLDGMVDALLERDDLDEAMIEELDATHAVLATIGDEAGS
jgi:cell division protease FtsH